MKTKLAKFFHSESAVGIVLFLAAFLAILLENSALSSLYQSFLNFEINLSLGEKVSLAYDAHYWINDGLMVLFFLLVGLEIKREFLVGKLSSIDYMILPALAAVGGIVAPALIYWGFNHGSPALAGWAIPAATDIAFAVGVISLFGTRLPVSVKLFVLTLAVIDDIAAISIIALFYTADLNLLMLAYSLGCGLLMLVCNFLQVRSLTPYVLLGVLTWFFMLKTGIHATLAGIIIALCVPLRVQTDSALPAAFSLDLGSSSRNYISPARRLEESLHSVVNFGVLPLFAFANSGLNLAAAFAGSSLGEVLFSGISAGVLWGLLLGKPLGVLICVFIWNRLIGRPLPAQIDYLNMLGIGLVSGIGFTMSILISTIAFAANPAYFNGALVGVLMASVCAALLGSLVFLYWISRQKGSAT